MLAAPFHYRFNLNAFERGDIGSRYRSYAVGRQWGWLSTNDVRTLEDMPSVENGDEYLTPLNMVPAGTVPPPAEPGAPAPPGGNQ